VNGIPIPRKLLTVAIILALAFLACYPVIRPFAVVKAEDQTQYYTKDFSWNYGGETWTWTLNIPATLVDAYLAVPDSARTQIPLSNFGYYVTTEDSYLQSLVQRINQTATNQGFNQYQEENFALAFVQSIPYQTDLNSTGYQDYPRFPVETLYDNVGDCKSHSILFATLTLMLGFNAVFINPPDHLAVGVLGDGLSGTYWSYDNQNYYYCETTGEGFTIGQLPDQFNGVGAYVYPIDASQQYVVNQQSVSFTAPDPTSAPYSSTPQSTPTFGPNTIFAPTPAYTPAVAGPTAIPVQPVSLNLISQNPLLFVVIIVAIAICVTLVIMPRRSSTKPVGQVISPTPSTPVTESVSDKPKFCVHCGTSNKPYAIYCGNCGQKITEAS